MTNRTCPICDKPVTAAYTPFCSKRCADVDLGRWMTEGYAIPVVDDEVECVEDDPSEEETRH